ncbi:MAG: GNAT family N-acetyltransferase [Jatrophihabitans sp.]
MIIRLVNQDDDADVATWLDVVAAARRHDEAEPATWPHREWTLTLRDAERPVRITTYLAEEDGVAVGTGVLEFTLRDNPTLSDINIQVLPEHRRRGIGTALFERLRADSLATGRTCAITFVDVPLKADASPGSHFAIRHGLTVRIREAHQVLRLPIATAHLEQLIAGTEARSRAYRFELWTGPCPEQWAEEYAGLLGGLSTEAPSGDTQFEADCYDVDRLRASERLAARQGRQVFNAVAVAPDGTLAGHTQLLVPDADLDPDRAYQAGTLVWPAHRGHQLGLALKARIHLAAQQQLPELHRMVHTWNAEQNSWMIAVNEALGYRRSSVEFCLQGDL